MPQPMAQPVNNQGQTGGQASGFSWQALPQRPTLSKRLDQGQRPIPSRTPASRHQSPVRSSVNAAPNSAYADSLYNAGMRWAAVAALTNNQGSDYFNEKIKEYCVINNIPKVIYPNTSQAMMKFLISQENTVAYIPTTNETAKNSQNCTKSST